MRQVKAACRKAGVVQFNNMSWVSSGGKSRSMVNKGCETSRGWGWFMASAKKIDGYWPRLSILCDQVVDGPVVFELKSTARYLDRGTNRILDCCNAWAKDGQ